MSDPNIERLREGYDLFNSGVREPLPEYWHEDGEYHVSVEDPDSEICRGIDAVRRQYARWVEAYPDLKVEALDMKANGDEVFTWVRLSGHGAGSGVPIEMELAHVTTMRDGKIARVVEYTDRGEALKAAGLDD